jgi:hypothetical protein
LVQKSKEGSSSFRDGAGAAVVRIMPAAWAAAAAARSLAVGGYYEGLAKSLKIQDASTYETRVCFASS